MEAAESKESEHDDTKLLLVHNNSMSSYGTTGADLGGQGGPVPPFKNFLFICYYYYKQHENFIQ